MNLKLQQCTKKTVRLKLANAYFKVLRKRHATFTG